jgi:hypothetical protein
MSGVKQVDAAKAMGNFTGWTYTAVKAIASEVANIQFRLYQVKGDDQQEVDPDHELLTLLDGVNEHMTGPELKYVTMAHLELTGNFFWLLDGVKNDTDKPRAIYPLNPGRAVAISSLQVSFIVYGQKNWLPQDYEVPKSGGNYLKFDEDTTKFRVMSQLVMEYENWNGDNKPVRSKEPIKGVPEDARLDDGKFKPKHFWAFVVWNYKDAKLQILEITQATIQRAIQDLVMSEDWGETPRQTG